MLPTISEIKPFEQRKLIYTSSFERTLKKLLRKQPLLQKMIDNVLTLLIQNPFNPTLGSHKIVLYGDEKVWSSMINFSYRILWSFDDQRNIELRLIGDHDSVY
jgi:mRNA interferase YafQ